MQDKKKDMSKKIVKEMFDELKGFEPRSKGS